MELGRKAMERHGGRRQGGIREGNEEEVRIPSAYEQILSESPLETNEY